MQAPNMLVGKSAKQSCQSHFCTSAALTPCEAGPIACDSQGVLMPASHPLHLAVPHRSNSLGRWLGRVHELHGGCRCAGRSGLEHLMLSSAGHTPDSAGKAAAEERQLRDAPGIKIDRVVP